MSYDCGLNFGYDQINVSPISAYDIIPERINNPVEIKSTEDSLREKMYMLEKTQRAALPQYINKNEDLYRNPRPGHERNSMERMYYDIGETLIWS